jgi:hypothetical protein
MTDPNPDIAARRQARLEDVAWLVETGENLTRAAARLGMNRRSLARFLQRHARHQLQPLLAREPRDHNARTHELRSAA